MRQSIYDTIDRLSGDDAFAVEQAAARNELPPWLLPGLIGIEHSRVGRFTGGGLRARVTALLEHAAAAKGPPPELRVGTVRGLGPDEVTELVGLELKWFRQFADARLEFGRDPGRPIVLVEGRNGYGKTHLVEALRFALQGQRRSDLDELLHEYVPAELDEAAALVVVELDSTSDGAVRIRKAVPFRRGADGAWRKATPALTVEAGSLAQPLQDREAEDWLAQRFPPEVLDYFIFDAESSVVQSLSGQRGERLPDVREQVEAAVGVRPLRAVAKRCLDVARDWEKRVGDVEETAGSEALEAEARASLDEAERLEAGCSALEEQREDRARELEELTATLRGLDEAPATDAAREELRRAELDFAHHLDLLRSSLDEVLPLALLAAPVGALLTGIGTARRWRDHPERARGARDAATELARAVREERFDWARPSGEVDVLAELLELLGLDGDDRREELHELRRRARAARAVLPSEETLAVVTGLPARIEELRDQLASVDSRRDEPGWRRDFDSLVTRRDEASGQVRRLEQELRDRRERARELRELAEDRTRAARRARKAERARDKLRAKIDLARRAERALGELAQGFLARRLDAMERAASEKLRDIAHKRDLYDRIEIDRRTLRYRIVDRDGTAVPPDRSTGERMVLALALVHGLRRASGLRFPLFVEAPLKGLDAMHQDRVIRHFLLEFRGQTVLLIKPGEIPDSAAHLVREQVGERFCLSRPQEGRDVTRIDRGVTALVGSAR